MILYKELDSIPAFTKAIRKFWILDNLANDGASEPKFALPNGCFTLAFISGEGVTISSAAGTAIIKEGIYLFGQLTTKLGLCVKPFTKAIMAQLHPWAVAFFTNLPLHELTNTFLSFQEANPTLYKKIKKLDLVNETLVVDQFYQSFEPILWQAAKPNLLAHMCEGIYLNTTNDAFRTRTFSAQLGYSERFIQKKFKNQIGLTPKEFYLIIKMRNLLRQLNTPKQSYSFTELALHYGFYDQSHFIKTFTGIMQISPKNYSAQDYILPFAEIT
ncbi:helix-turn-helix transcriptional regulator [Adhaeribacter radiodurans]|uniref:Helix-turn-helix transcriptional regulator n=1 Tax=Adhaeribacter radiodurans TaxID=2745197 RepID=A0A7L7LF10_9BACT|nr:helix-turn-helix transcriptional regulator [Adhaeribacter radiodurans]QMU31373.1 helix-turn-helix transcriptional regulator [Adhaeribacter radiodurans]